MLQRELAEMLRNPDGPYFGEHTPAMVALETMVDTVGLRNVLFALAKICGEKAEHVAVNWQDTFTGKLWSRIGIKIDRFADKLESSPLD